LIKRSVYIAISVSAAVLMIFAIGREPAAEQGTSAERLALRLTDHQPPELIARVQTEGPMTRQSNELDTKVAIKYEALLAALTPDTRDQLQRILVAREATQDSDVLEVARWERHVSLLLLEDEYVLYEQLREAESERAHLGAFAQQGLATSPLTSEQQHDLLIAKLKYKRQAQALEFQADTPRLDLPAMENGYARDIGLQGVYHYTRAFLDEVRTVLSDEQWRALEHFEKTAFEQRVHRSETAALQRGVEQSGLQRRESGL
jgi:hypothetical protein